jgi:molybdopterin converting factor small subunit
MNVTVHFYGQLRQFAGAESVTDDCPDGTTVADHLKTLAERYDERFARAVFDGDVLRPSVMVLVNDAAIRKAEPRPIADGDTITLLTAIAGG